MGNGLCRGHIKEPQIVVHEADQPDLVAALPHGDVLTGKHRADIDLATVHA